MVRTRPTASSAKTTRSCSRRTSPDAGRGSSACSTPARASRCSKRRLSRVWTDAPDLTRRRRLHGAARRVVHDRAPSRYADARAFATTRPSRADAAARASRVAAEIRARRVLILMLGDTSMGMINGYFGPRLLAPIRLHRAQGRPGVDHRSRRRIERQAHRRRVRVREGQGRHLPLERGHGATDFDEHATREQLRDYLVVLDLLAEFKADCLGWQYQLGLIPLRPPSRSRRGPVQLDVPSRVERRHHRHRDRGRPGQRHADGDDEAAARRQGPALRR